MTIPMTIPMFDDSDVCKGLVYPQASRAQLTNVCN
jgi:hypothetical protein